MEKLLQDLRYSWRNLWRSPGFTLVALLTLALGIGANSSIFSVINAALLKNVPYPKPQQLALLFERDVTAEGSGPNVVALPNFLDWQSQSRSFVAMTAERRNQFNLGGEGHFQPERIDGAICTWAFFSTFDVPPMLGRPFTASEDKHGAPHVAVISYGLWQQRFGGDPGILQRKIRLDSEDYSVIGVMPASFRYPERKVAVWVPVEQVLSEGDIHRRGNHQFWVIGRLRDGVTLEQAGAELDTIGRRIYKDHSSELVGRGASVSSLADEGTRDSRSALVVLFAAVGCLLLIACVNIANLLLARGSERHREMAIRAAVGASPARLQLQLLTESVLLSMLGAVAGLLLAYGLTSFLSVRALLLLSRGEFDTSSDIRLDLLVFLFTAGVALLSGLATGIVPAFQLARKDLTSGLKESGRSATAGRSQGRFRSVLVTAEVALSLVLLVAAGLLARSFAELRRVNPGLRVEQTLTAGISLPDAHYPKRQQIAAYARQLTSKLQQIPGVRAAGLVSCLPVGGYCGDNSFRIEGQPLPRGQFILAMTRSVTPGYFASAGIPLIAGRELNDLDNTGFDDEHPHDSAIVISQSMAKKFFPNNDALGKRLLFGDTDTPGYRIVGIVGDVLFTLDRPPRPTMYTSVLEGYRSNFYAIIHTSADPIGIAAAVRREITNLDPDIPAFEIRPMTAVLDESAARREFTMLMLGLFAVVALALAAVGLYGVLSYAVAQRTSEIGIRMALGAARSQVQSLVMLDGMRPALAGVVLGILGATWATGLLKSLLFGISANDIATFIAVPILLLLVALAACAIPAWRATRVDPVIALRSE
jgi:putative ABC transport system permease protein